MTISMYQASLPIFIRALRNLDAILAKGVTHAEAKKIDPAVLVAARLYPDMYPLTRQVQVATDMAKGCAARLAGEQPPAYEDNENSFPELSERIRKTVAFLENYKPEQIDGTEEKEIVLNMRSGPLTFNGLDYLSGFVIPNFFFHVTTAYDILRHNGVGIGKRDFMGGQ